MSFFHPGMWWLALTLPAILALYILRPRRKQTLIPSTMLWRPLAADLEASRPWQRLQSRLLLWLQLLAAALLVLAALGPVWLAPADTRSTIVLLDASASMQAVEGDQTRFDLAREEVLAIAAGLRGDSAISVIAFDRQPRVVVRDCTEPGELRRALEKEAPSSAASDPAPAFSLAEALARQYQEPRLVLISDGGIDLPGNHGGIEYIPVGKKEASVAIAALNLRPSGSGQAAQVTVVNHGSAAASGTVSLYKGNYPSGSRKWQLDPGQAEHILWTGLPAGVSVYAELKPNRPEMDVLELDNRAWAVPENKTKRKVLLVTGGNVFLEKALGLMPGAEVYKADAARYGVLVRGEYPYDITVLDGVAQPLPPGAALLLDPPVGTTASGLTVGPQINNVRLESIDGSPLLKHVELADINIRDARVLKLEQGWQSDIKSGENVLFARGEVEGRNLAAWSINLHRSDLPLRPAFPVLLQNTLDWLMPPSLGLPRQALPGEEIKFVSLPLARSITVEDQDRTIKELAPPFPPSPWVPGEPGLYRLIAYREGGSSVHEIAVNGYSPTEADLKIRDPRQSGEASAGEGPPDTGSERPVSLVHWLALAALLLVMTEWGVASRGR